MGNLCLLKLRIIYQIFISLFSIGNHEAKDVRLFGDRNPHHFVQRRSGIETGGICP